MQKKLYLYIFYTVLIFLSSINLASAQVSTTQIVPLSGPTYGRYDKFELGIQLNKTDFINVYDPNEISVEVQFLHSLTLTSKKVDAFWYKDFQINANTPDPTFLPYCSSNHIGTSDPNFMTEVGTQYPWRVRFAPDLLGTWQYRVIVKYNNVTTYTSPYTNFTVVNTGNKGFVSIDNTLLRKLKYDNHTFTLIGTNIVEKGSVVFNRAVYNIIKEGITKLSSAGANTIRIWMTPEQLGIEWDEDGLGRYDTRQNRAYLLDELFRLAEQNNIKIQLCLTSNHEISNSPDGAQNQYVYWQHNPYSTLTGTFQYGFYGNTNARNLLKRRLKYIIARYGYSTALLSYELVNEYDIIGGAPTGQDFWSAPTPANIKDWHIDLSSYIKSKDSKHLVTTSAALTQAGTATPSSDNIPIFGISTLDYVQDHFYNNNLNKDHNLSALSQYSLNKYNKGYVTGEIGARIGWIASSSFNDPDFSVLPAGQHGNGYNDFHNSTWTSLFSGTLGTGLNWSWGDIGNSCWGGAYLQYKPVQLFLQNDYFFDSKVIYIKNKPTGLPGPKDFQSGGVGNNALPYWMGITDADISYGIETNQDDSMDVFAAMGTDKIYGWVHNRYNYWYNLPHGSDPANGLNDNTPFVPTLNNKTFTIKNVNCDGNYKVDFYATYPQFDINGDNIQDNGGLIPSLSISGLTSYCGSLTIPVPSLKPLALGNNTLFPDYAFKITKESDLWNHWTVTGSTSTIYAQVASYTLNSPYTYYNDNNGAIRRITLNTTTNSYSTENISSAAPATAEASKAALAVNDLGQVFYKGADNRLQFYYNNNGSWVHDYLTNWSNTSENIGDYITATNLNVYYQGYNDGRIHRYYFNPSVGSWQHSLLPNFGNTSMNINGPIATNANGTQVFYKGADGRLQQYYIDNNTWYHNWLTDWNNTSQNIGGDLTFIDNKAVYYVGADGKLHVYRYVPGTGWVHDYISNISNNQTISIPLASKIAVYPNEEQIFFTGSDGYITHLWGRNNNKFNVDNVLCNAYLKTSMKARTPVVCTNNETIYYLGQDLAIHSFAFDNGCVSNNTNFMSGIIELKDQTTGDQVNENVKDDLYKVDIYPNPFGSSINIDLQYDGEVQVTIYDLWGRIVHNGRLIGNKVNTENLSKGIYLVKISSQHFSVTRKVVKE